MIFKVPLSRNATVSVPEGFLLCALDYVQDQDYLLQKAVVLLFAGLRGNPGILWCYEEQGRQCPLPRSPRHWHPASSVEVIPPLLCGQTRYLQGSTHETIGPFDGTKPFGL